MVKHIQLYRITLHNLTDDRYESITEDISKYLLVGLDEACMNVSKHITLKADLSSVIRY